MKTNHLVKGVMHFANHIPKNKKTGLLPAPSPCQDGRKTPILAWRNAVTAILADK